MNDHDSYDALSVGARVFRRWREQRASPRSHVPAELRQIACLLLEVEPLAVVSQALRINIPMLRRWSLHYNSSVPPQTDIDGCGVPVSDHHNVPLETFVPLPPLDDQFVTVAPVASPEPTTSLIIERTDGVRLHLGGPLDYEFVASLLSEGSQR